MFLPAGSSFYRGTWECKPVSAAGADRDNAACKHWDLQEKQERRIWQGSKRLKSSPSDAFLRDNSPDEVF